MLPFRALRPAPVVLAALLLVGCGGSTTSQALDGTTATVSAAKGAQAFWVMSGVQSLASLAVRSRGTAANYSSALDLYYTVTFPSLTTAHVAFTTEPDGAGMDAGVMDLTITEGEPYPVEVHAVFDVTSRGTRVVGATDVTLYDAAGSHIGAQGSYQSMHPNSSGVVALDYTPTAVTGTLSLTVDPRTVVFTDIIYVSTTGQFSAAYSVQSTSGTVQRNADGSGTTTCTTDQGTFTLSWSTDQTATIQLPNGTTKVLGKLTNL